MELRNPESLHSSSLVKEVIYLCQTYLASYYENIANYEEKIG